jgi:hypothetical protein
VGKGPGDMAHVLTLLGMSILSRLSIKLDVKIFDEAYAKFEISRFSPPTPEPEKFIIREFEGRHLAD